MPVSPLCSVGTICDQLVMPKGIFFMSIFISFTGIERTDESDGVQSGCYFQSSADQRGLQLIIAPFPIECRQLAAELPSGGRCQVANSNHFFIPAISSGFSFKQNNLTGGPAVASVPVSTGGGAGPIFHVSSYASSISRTFAAIAFIAS
jgi:hypothetical protein